MSFARLFFSFRGRISRSMFWIGLLAIIGAGFSGYHLFSFALTHVTNQYAIDPATRTQVLDTALFIAFALAAVAIWTLFVKRLHDRGKSAWMFVLFASLAGAAATWIGYLPIAWLPRPAMPDMALRASGIIGGIGALWLLVEALIIPSRPGANRYGPDPLVSEC